MYYKDMKEITVNSMTFEALRTFEEYIYVDKTEYIYSLVRSRLKNYYFISRPRRFGKSLMCSTLQCLFEGKRNLFEGLYIDNTDYSFEKYPILHFDFSDIDTSSYESFLDDFQSEIISEAGRNGIKVERNRPSSMLKSFLNQVDKEVVIIVDEYDTPIIHSYKDREKSEKIRETLSVFYAVIKSRNAKIRFFFLTGITKFSNMSIFSQMNNLTDLTFDKRYAAAFGYTEDELLSNFSPYIDEYMARDDREYETRDEFIAAIRDYYDGYRFSDESQVKVYNPVSVGFFFNNSCSFKPYWENTGVNTQAVELAKDYHLESIISENPILPMSSINTFDYSLLREHKMKDLQVLALIYFTGYLTIENGDTDGLDLTFPNTEIRKTFTLSLVERFTGIETGLYAKKGVSAIREGDIDKLERVFNAFLKEFPYTILSEKEKSYQEAFFSFFLMLGFERIDAEETSLTGRSDVVLSTSHNVYVIEMKVDESADKAIEQIKTKGYYAKYINTNKAIHIIGLNFSSEVRQIIERKEEMVDKTKEPTYLG